MRSIQREKRQVPETENQINTEQRKGGDRYGLALEFTRSD